MATKFSNSLHFPTLAGQPLPAAGGASLEAAFLKAIFAEIAGAPIRAADKATAAASRPTQHGRGASTDAGPARTRIATPPDGK